MIYTPSVKPTKLQALRKPTGDRSALRARVMDVNPIGAHLHEFSNVHVKMSVCTIYVTFFMF